MSINLWPPSSEHWNINTDLRLTLTIDTYQQQCEAKRVEQDPEKESAGAEASPKEVPAPEKAPQVVAGGSKAVSPTETASILKLVFSSSCSHGLSGFLVPRRALLFWGIFVRGFPRRDLC